MTRWVQAARDRGVVFDAGAAFTLNGVASAGARLGFACLTDDELEEAVRRLVAAAKQC
jgi:DNA-binding transcriptional MocR family regulator